MKDLGKPSELENSIDVSPLPGQVPSAPLVTSTVSGGQRASLQLSKSSVKEAGIRPGDSGITTLHTCPNTTLGFTVGSKEQKG